ncbi:hypothetical protein EWM64_g136 [Hericium alpestre]|uniref:BTB domain-containing protein n=1 Tax=Hericium alpestre TaxID=135208 RepID=A0A4Z0A9Y3_9AGAM|nr:hypothetical protein EWM64_g136 [Hericium alpestre]
MPPFDDTNADIVLRSCDQVNFFVYKNILLIASSVFKDMFSLPQPTVAPDSSPVKSEPISQPITEVAEDAKTLDFILRCVYPVEEPELQQSDIYLVLEAGRKYDIKGAVKAAEAAMLALMDKNALAAFALAVQFQMEHICAIGARRLLKQELMEIRSSSSSEVSYISARPIRKLLQYHGVALKGRSWGPCCQKDERSDWFAHQDVWDHLKEAEETLPLCPHSEAMLSPWWPIDVSCESRSSDSRG